MHALFILFFVVLVLNVIPAFAPPTWMVFSYLGFRYPDHPTWLLALVGATAATLGRFLLAKMSRVIVRKRWLSEAARANVDTIKVELEKRPRLTFGAFLFYAFTPLPSHRLWTNHAPPGSDCRAIPAGPVRKLRHLGKRRGGYLEMAGHRRWRGARVFQRVLYRDAVLAAGAGVRVHAAGLGQVAA